MQQVCRQTGRQAGLQAGRQARQAGRERDKAENNLLRDTLLPVIYIKGFIHEDFLVTSAKGKFVRDCVNKIC